MTAVLEHEAFTYDSDDGYAGTLGPLLDAAAASGAVAIAVVPEAMTAVLRRATTASVEYVPAEDWYRHPTGTIARYDGVLRDLGGRPAVVIGEVRFGHSEREWTAWTRYEAALNRALARHHARVVCPYDTRALPPALVAAARRTHPMVLSGDGRAASDSYVEPEPFARALPPTVTVPDRAPDVDVWTHDRPRAARHAFIAAAAASGLDKHRIDELTLGVHEVLANAITHGGGRARLRVWAEPGAVTCAVDDAGGGDADPLFGLCPPDTGTGRGAGAWLARQLFDHSDVATAGDGGLRILLSAGG